MTLSDWRFNSTSVNLSTELKSFKGERDMTIYKIPLGQFENVSGRFALSDPCYKTDVWCRGELDNVRKGTWNAEIGQCELEFWGKRPAILTATHSSFDEDAEGDYSQDTADFEVGVDSGQAGIFDAAHYRDDSVFPPGFRPNSDYGNGKDVWYGFCCDTTLNAECQAGVIPFGTVSSSGFGDGGYECTFWKDSDGEIIKVIIVFIYEDNEKDNAPETVSPPKPAEFVKPDTPFLLTYVLHKNRDHFSWHKTKESLDEMVDNLDAEYGGDCVIIDSIEIASFRPI
jgi:hypothetical protein